MSKKKEKAATLRKIALNHHVGDKFRFGTAVRQDKKSASN